MIGIDTPAQLLPRDPNDADLWWELIERAVATLVKQKRRETAIQSLPVVLVARSNAAGRLFLDQVNQLLVAIRGSEATDTANTRCTALDFLRDSLDPTKHGQSESIVLLDRMPLLPHWNELVASNGHQYVATATAAEWAILARQPDPPLATVLADPELTTIRISNDRLQADRIDRLGIDLDDPTHVARLLLASLGVPLDPETVERLTGRVAGNDRVALLAQDRAADAVEEAEFELDVSVLLARLTTKQAENGLHVIFRNPASAVGPIGLLLLQRLALHPLLRAAAAALTRGRDPEPLGRVSAHCQAEPNPFTRLAWAKLLVSLHPSVAAQRDQEYLRMVIERVLPTGMHAESTPEKVRHFIAHWRSVQQARLGGESVNAAIATMRDLERREPRDPYVRQALASLLRRAGRREEAQRALEEAEWLTPDNPYVLVESALIRTMPVLSAGFNIWPPDPDDWIANYSPTDDDYDAAANDFALALLGAPENGVVLNAWARMLRRRGRCELLEDDQDDTSVQDVDADGDEDEWDLDSEWSAAENTVDDDNDEFEMGLVDGSAVTDDQFAETLLGRAIKTEPWNVYHWVERATLRKKLGRLDEAIQDARRAQDLAPESLYPLVTLADALIEKARASRDSDPDDLGPVSALLNEAGEVLQLAEGENWRQAPVEVLTVRGILELAGGPSADRRQGGEPFANARARGNQDIRIFLAEASAQLRAGDVTIARSRLKNVDDRLGDGDQSPNEEAMAALVTLRARIDAARGELDRAIHDLNNWKAVLPPYPELFITLIELERTRGTVAGNAVARDLCEEARRFYPQHVDLEHVHHELFGEERDSEE